MGKQKVLKINCMLCDARTVTEETLAGYDQVIIRAGCLVESPESRVLLRKKGVQLKCDNVQELEGGVTVNTINGEAVLDPATAPAQKSILTVNGVLTIQPGCEELMANYLFMTINGLVRCPQSMAGLVTSKAVLNGTMEIYPDEAIRLNKITKLDRTFVLRAKEDALYYTKQLVVLDPEADLARLARQRVRFAIKQLVVAEGLVEAVLPMVDEQASVIIVPDACAFVPQSAVLDDSLVRKYGNQLYINGNLTVNKESLPVLDQISYLKISGKLMATPSMIERVSGMPVESQHIQKRGGTVLEARTEITIHADLLENAEEGLWLEDCAEITIAPNVAPALLREKLVGMECCSNIYCTEEQAAAILPVCFDCAEIGPKKKENQPESEKKEEDAEVVSINCTTYCL